MTTDDYRHLPIGDSISFGWETFKKWPWLLAGVTLAVGIASAMVNWAQDTVMEDGWFGLGALPWLVVYVVHQTIELGMANLFLKLRDHGHAEFSDLFTIFPRVPALIGANILAGIAICTGLVFLILPGIYLAIRLRLVPWIIADENMGPIDALKRSWELTRGHAIDLFIFGMLLFGINIAGLLALVAGLLVSVPVTGIAVAHMYRFLSAPQASDAVSEAPQV